MLSENEAKMNGARYASRSSLDQDKTQQKITELEEEVTRERLLCVLESLLLATASSLEEYADESTLKYRLESLFIAILRRRLYP
jgi:hypothetical protein